MASIFGASGAPQKPPSLFAPNTSSAQPSSTSLFGALSNAPASQPSGGLFGANSQQQQQQQQQGGGGTGLFGSLGSSAKPQQPSLFGNTTTTPSAQPQQSSLFGGTSTAQQNQPKQSSLFGGLSTLQQPQPQNQASSFANSSLGQQQSSSLFPASQQPQGQPPQSQQIAQHSAAYFDSLLERSRDKTDGKAELGDLPSLQLGLGDLRQRMKKLGPGSREQANDGRAHYLLAASGVDPGAAVRDLGYLETQSTLLPKDTSLGVLDTDVETYLLAAEKQTTLNMIANGVARSVRDFDNFVEENMAMEWDAQRKRIYDHFGIKPKHGAQSLRDRTGLGGSTATAQSGFGRSKPSRGLSNGASMTSTGPSGSGNGRFSLRRSVIGTTGPVGSTQQPLFGDVDKSLESGGSNIDDRALREKQGKLADRVQNLNTARLDNRPFPILHHFADVEAQSADQHAQNVIKAYQALIEMVGEDPDIGSLSDPSAKRERHFADSYLDEAENSAKAVSIRKMVLAGANRYLEKHFYQDLEVLIARNPREANLGGVPNVLSKIRAYVRLRHSRKDLVPESTGLQTIGDDYVWPLVFYLLRSGHVQEAMDYVTNNAVAFHAIDRNFVTYISDYNNGSNRRLRRDLQDRINGEYNQRLRIAPENSIDPFKMACYKVIGRCDISKRNLDGINQSMDDWVWLQFNLAREVSRMDEMAGEMYGLAEVQKTIQEVGSRHFPRTPQNSSYGVFFYLQILAGLFEQAVAYLYYFQYVDAVHVGIALEYYGLLRASDPTGTDTDLLTHSTRGLPQISFGRMIGYYTRDFRAANVVAAVDYLTLICLNADIAGQGGRLQIALSHEALRELVLESREFAKLLGDIQSNGQRMKGAIQERMKLIALEDTDDFMRTVTIQAACVADDTGRTTDAVLLYHLAEEFDNVIVIINRALSEAVSLDINQGEMKFQPLKPRDDQKTIESRQQNSKSLSLTSVDDPVVLAKTMMELYDHDRVYYDKIRPINRDACGVLVRMSEVKARVAGGRWVEALDILADLDILPLRARGDGNEIRKYATKFSSLPDTIQRNVPNLMLWAILCCDNQRSVLSTGQFGGNDGTRRAMKDDLLQQARDLMMYSGFLKYRLPSYVNEALARAAAE